ncbi:flagellin [Pinisolibacter aquiterrae]|uniref:flagellin n=1 Tax=Pinisolibacter aquiterrae TaxID=2815579 RepID=UPI001C3D8BC7|nr:flagellin [Pinisolibacter aquiterrae]MBV5265302.1 hypothetical protein [Pinisolibacter aquiterrae]MCC8235370.1 hypothetical protein [Pinisolibacter aquiterrae]
MDIKNYSYTGLNGSLANRLSAQRAQMSDLTQQEVSQLKAPTYKGIENRSLTLAFQAKIAQNESYQSTITTINTRLSVLGNSLDAMSTVSQDLSGVLGTNGYQLTSSGQTSEQIVAKNALETYISTLNTDVDGQFVFAGKASDVSPVVDLTTMLEGNGVQAGYKTVAAQRLQADLGSDGLGRLDLTSSGSDVTLAEDGSHVFGMKLTGVTSTLSNVTTTGPSGTPASLSIDVTGQPTAGEAMDIELTLPDGTTTKVTLTAGTEADTANGTFAIGATTDETAANIQAALQAQLETTAKTDLTAASAEAAANNFFDTAGGAAPMRVDGPPYDTATELVAGTEADTVMWYRGTNDAETPRADAHAEVEDGLTVNYGVRANEGAFTSQIKQLAVLSTIDVSGGTDTDQALFASVVERTKGPLEATTGSDSLQSVAAEIAGAQSTAKSANTRMTVANNTYQAAVDGALGIDETEVAVKMTTLQTQIEASYKASAILYKLTLTNYL